MPRLRVDVATTEDELLTAIHNLFAASAVIDAELASGRQYRQQQENRRQARDGIHDEIERLTNIVRYRRTRVSA